jgi:hypothetical protein
MKIEELEIEKATPNTEEDDYAMEQNLDGMEAGRAFAHRHIIDKMNLFIKVYREKNYSEFFVEGFIDGINEVTGGTIHLSSDEENVPTDIEQEQQEDCENVS